MTGSGITGGNKVDGRNDVHAQQSDSSSIHNNNSDSEEVEQNNLQDFDSWLDQDPLKDVPIILREEYNVKLKLKVDAKPDRNGGFQGGIGNRNQGGVPQEEEYGLFRGRGPSRSRNGPMSTDPFENRNGDVWQMDNFGPLSMADSWDQNIEPDNLNTIILTDPALRPNPNDKVLYGGNPQELRRMRASCSHIFICTESTCNNGQLGQFKRVQVCLKCFEIHCPASAKFEDRYPFDRAEPASAPLPREIAKESTMLRRVESAYKPGTNLLKYQMPLGAKSLANANEGRSFCPEESTVQSRNKNPSERDQSNQQYSNSDRNRTQEGHGGVEPDCPSEEQRTGHGSSQSTLNRPIGSHYVHTRNPNRETDERDLDTDETNGIFRNMLGSRKPRKYEPTTAPKRNDKTYLTNSSRDIQDKGIRSQTSYDLTSHMEPSNFIRQANEASSTRFQEAGRISRDEGGNSFRQNKHEQPSSTGNQRGAPRGMSRGRPRQRTRGRPLRRYEDDSSSPSSMMSSSPEKNYARSVSNTSASINSAEYERQDIQQDEYELHDGGRDRDDGLLSRAHFDQLTLPGFSDSPKQNNCSNDSIRHQQSSYRGRGRASANVRTRTAPSSKPSNKFTEVRDEENVMGYSIRLEDNSSAKLTSPLKGVNDFKYGPPTETDKQLEGELKAHLRIGRASSNQPSSSTSRSLNSSSLSTKKSDDIVVSYERRMNGLWRNLPEKSIFDNDNEIDHTTSTQYPQVSNDNEIDN